MNKTTEALKLALEALVDHVYMAQKQRADAITALRQALNQLPDTTKMIDTGTDRGAWSDVPDATKWVDELRGGDETEQEPVATVVKRQYEDGTYAGNALDWAGRNCEDDFPVGTKLYTDPQPVKFNCTVVDDDHPEGVPLSQWGQQQKQNPFCYHDGRNIVGKEFADHSDVFPLYTAPPLRQWQWLTQEDLFDIAIVNFGEPDLQLFIEMGKLVQKELKEKNHD